MKKVCWGVGVCLVIAAVVSAVLQHFVAAVAFVLCGFFFSEGVRALQPPKPFSFQTNQPKRFFYALHLPRVYRVLMFVLSATMCFFGIVLLCDAII